MPIKDEETILRKKIYKIIKTIITQQTSTSIFTPGKDMIRYAGAIYDHEELEGMINAILDGWFGVGKYVRQFESRLSKLLLVKKTVMTNSGSSANLIAMSALRSNQLDNNLRLRTGDEVVTPALTFPTTFNPIIQNGLVPVLVDVDPETYNFRAADMEKVLSKKTRAIFIPHTLGNPNEMDSLTELAEDNDLFLIEDACDALGAKYNGQNVGSFGSFGTFSFYPSHQITTGEGGAIVTKNEQLADIAFSLRDWGRACTIPICNPIHCSDKECSRSARSEKTFNLGVLPEDYDKRYTYTNIGFNLKPTEIQAAMGLAQLKKLPSFIEARTRNFQHLYEHLREYEKYFVLPKALPKSKPCWFAFPLTIKKNAPFKRMEMVKWFTKHRIEVKMLFTGNILKHPAYKNVKHRVAQKLCHSNNIMRNSFFIGIYPGLTEKKLGYIKEVFTEFIERKK